MRYVLGLNQYSHDAGCCLLSLDGAQSIVVPNERITRRKHDGGDTAAAVKHALEASGAQLEDVVAVCTNNHHHRVADFERRLPWSVKLGLYPESALSSHNLLPGVPHMELSHHLAHAWSVLAQAPFDEGLVVVMDGMGETYSAMARHQLRAEDDPYTHDLQLEACERAGFVQVPRALEPHVDYREAETVYAFSGTDVHKVFKRWVPERSPPELYNHGFENLESLGALYSRISSHLFGDWNACGKVMGLGPWVGRWGSDAPTRASAIDALISGRLEEPDGPDMLRLDWRAIEGLPHPNGVEDTMAAAGTAALDVALEPAELHEQRAFHAELASRVQTDLEDAALGFLSRLQQRTGHTNVCLAGGVVQNSVLNGRICREAGFTNVFIPPCVGDEGIPIGCAAYAQQVMAANLDLQPPTSVRRAPWSAYQGRAYSSTEVRNAIEEFAPWLEYVDQSEASATEMAAQALHAGEIVGWFEGRAEVGARALGHRSILSDPRRADMHRRVNVVKQREQWRPLAPSVLAEHAESWFDGVPACGSPFMSITATVKAEAREKVPAVTHVDGSARLQTVDATDAPLYYALILAFFALSGVPMVMNTSFNLANMPIVEVRERP